MPAAEIDGAILPQPHARTSQRPEARTWRRHVVCLKSYTALVKRMPGNTSRHFGMYQKGRRLLKPDIDPLKILPRDHRKGRRGAPILDAGVKGKRV